MPPSSLLKGLAWIELWHASRSMLDIEIPQVWLVLIVIVKLVSALFVLRSGIQRLFILLAAALSTVFLMLLGNTL